MTIRLRNLVQAILMDSHPLSTQLMDSRKAGNRCMHTDMELDTIGLVKDSIHNISMNQDHTQRMATR